MCLLIKRTNEFEIDLRDTICLIIHVHKTKIEVPVGGITKSYEIEPHKQIKLTQGKGYISELEIVFHDNTIMLSIENIVGTMLEAYSRHSNSVASLTLKNCNLEHIHFKDIEFNYFTIENSNIRSVYNLYCTKIYNLIIFETTIDKLKHFSFHMVTLQKARIFLFSSLTLHINNIDSHVQSTACLNVNNAMDDCDLLYGQDYTLKPFNETIFKDNSDLLSYMLLQGI